ncbi:GNAT family N-acetyltransferase [Geodermatophilus sp. SYSU D00700]
MVTPRRPAPRCPCRPEPLPTGAPDDRRTAVTDSAAQVVDRPDASRFEVLVDGEVAGFAEYRRTPSSVSFSHTVIDPAFEGRGLGSVLARRALDAVRAEGGAVLPFCPFIRAWIEHHPDYLDLVPAHRRVQFRLPADPRPEVTPR